jgi:hypothetical protein
MSDAGEATLRAAEIRAGSVDKIHGKPTTAGGGGGRTAILPDIIGNVYVSQKDVAHGIAQSLLKEPVRLGKVASMSHPQLGSMSQGRSGDRAVKSTCK